MARLSLPLVLLALIFIIMSSFLATTSHGRKLLLTNEHEQPLPPPHTPMLFDRLYMAALPKGTVPFSAPTKKGHADTIDEKLVARHLIAIHRILRTGGTAIPSPAGGH